MKTYISAKKRELPKLRKMEPRPVPYDPSAKSFDLAMSLGLTGGVPATVASAAKTAAVTVARDSPAAREFRERLAEEARKRANDRMLALAALVSPDKTYVAVPAADAAQETRQAKLGGDNRFANGRNFLATDRVPDTIFGIPVAKAEGEWTEADLRFFKEHPEAGGYYQMGDEDEQ